MQWNVIAWTWLHIALSQSTNCSFFWRNLTKSLFAVFCSDVFRVCCLCRRQHVTAGVVHTPEPRRRVLRDVGTECDPPRKRHCRYIPVSLVLTAWMTPRKSCFCALFCCAAQECPDERKHKTQLFFHSRLEPEKMSQLQAHRLKLFQHLASKWLFWSSGFLV